MKTVHLKLETQTPNPQTLRDALSPILAVAATLEPMLEGDVRRVVASANLRTPIDFLTEAAALAEKEGGKIGSHPFDPVEARAVIAYAIEAQALVAQLQSAARRLADDVAQRRYALGEVAYVGLRQLRAEEGYACASSTEVRTRLDAKRPRFTRRSKREKEKEVVKPSGPVQPDGAK